MGVRVNITLFARSQTEAENGAKAAFARFAVLEQIMSDYRPDSEVMRLCDQAGSGPIPVSAELFTVLEHALRVADDSGGAFDITCGPLVRLWRESRKTKKLPEPAAIQKARELVGSQYILLNSEHRTASVTKKGVRLDLGGIAKGYGCDEAIKTLRENGIERALVEAGGDIVASGPPPGKLGWRISIRGLPDVEVWLKNEAISTSGDTEQFVEIGGVRYSHIVNPRTGLGVTNRVQVSVVAKDGLTSDSLATALCVLGPATGVELSRIYTVYPKYVLSKR